MVTGDISFSTMFFLSQTLRILKNPNIIGFLTRSLNFWDNLGGKSLYFLLQDQFPSNKTQAKINYISPHGQKFTHFGLKKLNVPR